MTQGSLLSLSGSARRVALTVGRETLTYPELGRACRAHLDRLAECGVGPGDRVGVWTHPSLATTVALVAHAAAGIVSVPLNPKLGRQELEHILGDARVRALVAADPMSVSSMTPSAMDARVEIDGADGVSLVPVDDSPALVLYTSGTTGPPKGALITRRNIAFDLDALADAWAWTPDHCVVHALPLFHVHGLVLGLFGALRVGGALHWLERFEPVAISRALRQTPHSMLFGVPTMYRRLADAAEDDPDVTAGLRAAHLLISGSAGLAVREHRRIEALAGRGVLERYGLTETLINCAVRADRGPSPGTVGPALRGVALMRVDDARNPVAPSDTSIAEIAVRGENVFAGYLNKPEATARVMDSEGWFYTGDLATQDPDGSIRIVGRRATDLIKTGGFKVGAGEVEAALLEHPAVSEVAVVGLDDEDLGQRIVAFVVKHREMDASAAGLIDHVSDLLSSHKRPREVRFVDALPRNAMGKVMKPQLISSGSRR